jgi:hypothetical protein
MEWTLAVLWVSWKVVLMVDRLVASLALKKAVSLVA